MAREPYSTKKTAAERAFARGGRPEKPSTLLDTRIVYCGDCLNQLVKLPGGCVDLIYIDPLFNSNRNYEVFGGETKEKRAFEDRHASTAAYIGYMRLKVRLRGSRILRRRALTRRITPCP